MVVSHYTREPGEKGPRYFSPIQYPEICRKVQKIINDVMEVRKERECLLNQDMPK